MSKKIFGYFIITSMCILSFLFLICCNKKLATPDNMSQTNSDSNYYENNGQDASKDSGFIENNTNIDSINPFEKIEETIVNDIQQVITQLHDKWKSFKVDICSYSDYLDNVDKIENFYDEIDDIVAEACVNLQKYTVQYAELIMKSNMSKPVSGSYFLFICPSIFSRMISQVADI